MGVNDHWFPPARNNTFYTIQDVNLANQIEIYPRLKHQQVQSPRKSTYPLRRFLVDVFLCFTQHLDKVRSPQPKNSFQKDCL